MSTALHKRTASAVSPASGEATRRRPSYQPRVDIYELPPELVVVADMPGLSSGDIDVQFENGTLTVYGKVADRQTESTRFLWQEYGVGDFRRSFEVGELVDVAGIQAEYADGELTLHLPKVEAAKARKITVKTK